MAKRNDRHLQTMEESGLPQAPQKAAPVASPVFPAKDRMLRQREIQETTLNLLNSFLMEYLMDRLTPAQMRQKAEVLMRGFSPEDQEIAVKTINQAIGRILSVSPNIPAFFVEAKTSQ